jgi:ferredoxin-NADP reductase
MVPSAHRAAMIARCRVLENRRETPTTHSVRIEKPRGFQFLPVHFCGLELDTDEGGIEYSMSLACSPTKPYLEFGARVASGSPWKRAFASLKEGDDVEVDGAYGHFVLEEKRPAVLLAGGIGITPLKGMLEYATDKALPIPVRLVYSNRTEAEIAYRADLDALVKQNPRAQVWHTITRPRESPGWHGRVGRIDAALAHEAAAGLEKPIYYVCGLPGMVADLARDLAAAGVPPRDVRFEQFWGYEG